MNKLLLPVSIFALGCCSAFAQTSPSPPTSAPSPLPAQTPADGNLSKISTVAAVHTRRLVREATASADNIKAQGNFGAQLCLVQGRSFFEDWKKPGTPSVDPVEIAVRGQPIYTAIIFYGAAHDDRGLSNVSYTITVTRPDGSMYDQRKDAIGWQDLAPLDDRQLMLGRDSLGINLLLTDPAGIYTVTADVHDNVSRATLPLKQTFVVQ